LLLASEEGGFTTQFITLYNRTTRATEIVYAHRKKQESTESGSSGCESCVCGDGYEYSRDA
jgi:hypothetical protein